MSAASCQHPAATTQPRIPAVEESASDKPPSPIPRDITMKTLGGRTYWGDVLFFHDLKIQQHTLTGHYRLLDGDDYRHASGSLQTCRAKLDEIRRRFKLPPMRGEAVILIHGITRSSKAVSDMRQRLRKEGYTVCAFGYPSTWIDIPRSADYLRRVIESLEGIERIHFVVHSMGGLIVRTYISGNHDKRIGRMVMIGTPNKGAWLADKLKNNPLYRWVYGSAGQQLVSGKKGYIHKLPIPRFPFAIIAGARGTPNGYNPLDPGDDDGVVTVASSRLPGAVDFLTVDCLHSFLMSHEPTIDAVGRFLKTGRLRATGARQPIPLSRRERRSTRN